jgi:hypothetical protein
MGCGASAGETIKEEDRNTMCQDVCVRMQVLCIWHAFENGKDLKIQPPPAVDTLKKNEEAMRKLAEEAVKKDATDAGTGDKGGGLVPGMMAMAKAGGDAVAEVKAAATASGLKAVADGLKTFNNATEKPFQEIAAEVVTENKEVLYNICEKFIKLYKFVEPHKLVESSDKEVISTTLANLACADLAKDLKPKVEEAIKTKTVTKTWAAAEEGYNECLELAKKFVSEDDLKKAGLEKISCDINEYITVEIIKALAKKMGEKEKSVRGDPTIEDKIVPAKPKAFKEIFQAGGSYTVGIFNNWKEEGK